MSRMFVSHDDLVMAESYLRTAIALQEKVARGVGINKTCIMKQFLAAADYYEKAGLRYHAAQCRSMASCYSSIGNPTHNADYKLIEGALHKVLFDRAESFCNVLRASVVQAQQIAQSQNPPAPSYIKNTYSHNPYVPVLPSVLS